MSSAALSSEESSGSGEFPRLVRVELLAGGMTCAAKVESKLSAIGNVSATVNYATEKATVTAPVSVPVQPRCNSVRLRRFGLPATARHPRRRTAAAVGDNPPGDGSQKEEQAASCLE